MATIVNNKSLYNELVISLEQGELTRTAIDMIMKMARKFSYTMSYMREADREDCIAQAIMDVYLYWKNFNPKYKNAFAYITQIIKNGFAKGWRFIHPVPMSDFISTNNLFTL